MSLPSGWNEVSGADSVLGTSFGDSAGVGSGPADDLGLGTACSLVQAIAPTRTIARRIRSDLMRPNACCSAAAARKANCSTLRCLVLRVAVRCSSNVSRREFKN